MDLLTTITENYQAVTLAAQVAVVGILEAIPKAWKPIRSFVGLFTKHAKEDRDLINGKLDSITTAIEQINSTLARHDDKLDVLQEQVCENEKDRLMQEIFKFGNYARRGAHISSEEFRYLQGVWRKYSEVLHGNDIAHDEYEMVREYYNGQHRRNSNED